MYNVYVAALASGLAFGSITIYFEDVEKEVLQSELISVFPIMIEAPDDFKAEWLAKAINKYLFEGELYPIDQTDPWMTKNFDTITGALGEMQKKYPEGSQKYSTYTGGDMIHIQDKESGDTLVTIRRELPEANEIALMIKEDLENRG